MPASDRGNAGTALRAGTPAPRTGRPGSAQENTAARAREREREKRLAERGDRILDALAALIARWGYGKTTVDDIAREAGVAKGTLYLHWPTKEAILQALIEREERQGSAALVERMAADPRGGTISGLYRHSLVLAAQSPLTRALLTQDRDALGEWIRSPRVRARSRRRMEAGLALIREMRAAALIRTDIAVEVQAYLIAALLYGILTIDEYLPADLIPPFEEIADAFAVVLRRGFETEPAADDDTAALARGRSLIAALMTRLAETDAPSGHGTRQRDPSHATENGRVAEHTRDEVSATR